MSREVDRNDFVREQLFAPIESSLERSDWRDIRDFLEGGAVALAAHLTLLRAYELGYRYPDTVLNQIPDWFTNTDDDDVQNIDELTHQIRDLDHAA